LIGRSEKSKEFVERGNLTVFAAGETFEDGGVSGEGEKRPHLVKKIHWKFVRV
jgi:hypothetical protein